MFLNRGHTVRPRAQSKDTKVIIDSNEPMSGDLAGPSSKCHLNRITTRHRECDTESNFSQAYLQNRAERRRKMTVEIHKLNRTRRPPRWGNLGREHSLISRQRGRRGFGPRTKMISPWIIISLTLRLPDTVRMGNLARGRYRRTLRKSRGLSLNSAIGRLLVRK